MSDDVNKLKQTASVTQPSDSGDSPRRQFLRKSIAILPVAALSGVGCTQTSSGLQLGAKTPSNSHGIQNNGSTGKYSPVFFHAAEYAFITAAVARLIPADGSGPGAVEAGVPEFIDRQMEGPFGHAATWYTQGPFVESRAEFGYQGKLPPRDVYRVAIGALDAHCMGSFAGKTFAQLDGAQQDALLKGLESGTLTLDGISGVTFFSFLLQNTKEGYFSDPMHGGNKNAASWVMIGFPGARADYIDWVGRSGEKYPLPPVTINGPQG